MKKTNSKLICIFICLALALGSASAAFATQPAELTQPATTQTTGSSNIPELSPEIADLPKQADEQKEAFTAGGDRLRILTDMRDIDGWPTAPSVSSRSAYAIELGSGEVLYAKNENEDRFPASITKIMTGLLACENCEMDEKVTFSHNAVTDLEEGGFNRNFYEGQVLTVEQCLYALMLNSVNECAYALAEHISGSVEAFAELMNKRAKELGCTNTHFVNPHGLNDPEHITTAHDMALIFWAAIQNEQFYKVDTRLNYTIPASETTKKISLTMHHKMMNWGSGVYDESVKAGKTGYTSLAFHTLATYAEKDGKEIIVICMKESTDGTVIYQDTRSLLNYGFKQFTLTDMTDMMRALAFGMNAASPFPLKISESLKILLPSSMQNVSIEPDGNGVKILSDGKLLATKEFKLSDESYNGNNANNGENTQNKGQNDSDGGPGFWSTFFKVLLVIIIIVISLAIILFVVLKYIRYYRKRQAMQRNRKRIAERARRAREERARALLSNDEE